MASQSDTNLPFRGKFSRSFLAARWRCLPHANAPPSSELACDFPVTRLTELRLSRHHNPSQRPGKQLSADAQTIRPNVRLLFVSGAGCTKKEAGGRAHVPEAEKLSSRILCAIPPPVVTAASPSTITPERICASLPLWPNSNKSVRPVATSGAPSTWTTTAAGPAARWTSSMRDRGW